MTHEMKRSWLSQLALVSAIFTLLGFCTSIVVFWNAPRFWSGSAQSGLAAGIAGGMVWMLLCGNRSRPAYWRTILAGMLAGVILHPIYVLLISCFAGEWVAPADLIVGSMFLLLIGGVIAVPSGVLAALACRFAGGWSRRPIAGQSHAPGKSESRP